MARVVAAATTRPRRALLRVRVDEGALDDAGDVCVIVCLLVALFVLCVVA
jgi:hypothetical protein